MIRFLSVLFVLLSFTVSAARFDITGDVGQIRYHEASNSYAPQWSRHLWFEISNVDAIPEIKCRMYSATSYAISIPDGNDTALSMLLSAKMSGVKVMVTVDDSQLFPTQAYCKLQYITIL